MASTAAAAGVIIYAEEVVLDLNEDEIERQRLISEQYLYLDAPIFKVCLSLLLFELIAAIFLLRNSNNNMASTAAAAGVITYADEVVLDLYEDEIERQRLIDDLFCRFRIRTRL